MRGTYASALVLTLLGVAIVLRTFKGQLPGKVKQWTGVGK